MERVVYKYVYNHLVRNKIIYEYQSGFLPKHSTVHQLLELYNTMLNSLEKKNLAALYSEYFQRLSTKIGTQVYYTK